MTEKSNYLVPEIYVLGQFESLPTLAASYGTGTPGVFDSGTDVDDYGDF